MNKKVNRFYWLDILRGIAALSVVLWHWHHFFFDNHLELEAEQHIDKTVFPFYQVLRPFYGQGWRAVEFFFALSGFIFFWLYSEKVEKKQIGFFRYFKLRISRLYPLHIIMLIIIVLEQQYYFFKTGTHFVYHDYGLIAFLGNLTLTSNWFYSHYSLNGPAWSISVEIFLYIIFFAFCLLRLNRVIFVFSFILLGWLLKGTSCDSTATGLMSFFTGGATYYLYNFILNKFRVGMRIFFIMFTFFFGFLLIVIYRYILKTNLPFYFFEFYMFPTIIFNIALLETTFGSKWSRGIAFLGNVSYSSYMIHFPLQLAFLLVTSAWGLNKDIYLAPCTLIIFYFILIGLSLLSYHFIEKPFQNYLRGVWINK